MLSNELRDQQEGKATRWAAFFDFQRAVAPCLNGCLFPTALISSCLNCRSLGGAEICLVSKRMFIPDGTPVLVTEYYILTQRNIETLNMVVCSATNVESCLCLKARKVWQRGRLRRWGRRRSDAELQRFFDGLSDIDTVIVIGHSLSEVDMEYFEKICSEIHSDAKWIFSCHDSAGLKAINAFVKTMAIGADRVTLFRL